MNFKRGVPWFNFLCVNPSSKSDIPKHEITKLHERSKHLYLNYISELKEDPINQSILEKGTLKDKFAAYKVMASETPLQTLTILESLNRMLDDKPRLQLDSINCGIEIYTKCMLPTDRTLRKFAEQPIRNAKDSHLLLYYFEDAIKSSYSEFITKIEKSARSPQPFLRDPAIRAIGELLRSCPENEHVLLNILIDKFGDPLSAVASVATNTILSVLKMHPQMNAAIVDIIQKEMKKFTPSSRKRALKFLGQINVNKKDQDTANEMLGTVKDELLSALKKPDPSNNKVISSLMKSVEKCASVCSPDELKGLIDPLYSFVSTSSFQSSLPALRLLYSIHKASEPIPQKFYLSLYSFFSSPDFGNSSKHPQLLNLLLQALEEESDLSIASSFAHKLLHIGLHMNIAFTASVLHFISKLFEKKPALKSIITSTDPVKELNYNIMDDNPLNSSSTVTFPWILSMYHTHYHPSIRELADSVVKGELSSYQGDPFEDFSTSRILNRIIGNGSKDDESGLFNNAYIDFDSIPDFEEQQQEEDD